jgi:TolA-binding protein
MSDLRRWSEEDATAEELSLLDVARRRRALPAQRAAVLSALGVGVATTTAAAAGVAGVGGLATKLVGLALLASVGVGVGVTLLHSGADKRPQAPAPSAATLPAATMTTASTAASAAPPEPFDAPREPTAKVLAKPKPAPAASSSLSRELQVLKQAHDALGKGNPNGALSALDDYHARFPQGVLGAEETVIRVQALLARGDRARAAAVAHQFSKAHPDSLYARRVEQLVSGVP